MQHFMQQMQENQKYQEQQGQQVVNQTVQEFATDPKNEFYRDVAGDMADILEMASNRGRNMSLQDAYSSACQLHPEVSKILNTRTKAPTSGQRRAATSIRGTPGGAGDNSLDPSSSMTDDISRAWDMQGRM